MLMPHSVMLVFPAAQAVQDLLVFEIVFFLELIEPSPKSKPKKHNEAL